MKNLSFSTSFLKPLKVISKLFRNFITNNLAFTFFHLMPLFGLHMFFKQKKYQKKRPNKSDVLGSNSRFLCPKFKIFCANTYILNMLLCYYAILSSFPNFGTVFDKISPKKNYIFKLKNWLIFFRCFQSFLRLFLQTNETFIWLCLTSPSKYWWNSPSKCLFTKLSVLRRPLLILYFQWVCKESWNWKSFSKSYHIMSFAGKTPCQIEKKIHSVSLNPKLNWASQYTTQKLILYRDNNIYLPYHLW
jgi:hypothetical protein